MLDIKRELDELIAIYLFEEELTDIYVEGPTDKFIIENYFEYKNLDKTIIEIDTINIYKTQEKFPDLDLKSHKDKLIALSRILNENKISANVTCIVDRDFDGILNPLETNQYIKYTDYSCIESYLLCKKHLDKLTKIGLKKFPHNSEIIIREISKVLHGLFLLRMVNKKFNFNFNFPRIENNITINKSTGICEFNFAQYVEKYINLNKLKEREKEISTFISDVSKVLTTDIRSNMNGHDFIEILFIYINKIKNTYNFRLENFENAIYLAIQPNHLDEYPLFREIAK